MNQSRSNFRSLVRGGIGGASSWAPLSRIGVTAAVVASTTVCGMSVASASQSGVGETVASPIVNGSVSQLGVSEVVFSSVTETPTAQRVATAGTARKEQAGQLGVSATVAADAPKDDGKAAAEKKAKDGREDDREEGAAEAAPAPAPERQAPAPEAVQPVQQAPVRQAPVQQAPVYQAPVQQAPVQQAPAPAPAPGITIDLGGRGPVVPQAPIAPKQLNFG